MPMEQNSEDPTGVSSPRPGTELNRARSRKANSAIQLRLSGATWAEIAEALGYPTARAALVATEKALEKQLTENGDRERMRNLAGQRLERLLRGVWSKAINPEDPEHLLASTKAREIIGQHAKLFGLDAPTEIVVHSPTAVELERWVAQVVTVGQPQVEEFDIFDADVIDDDDPPALTGS